MMFLALGTLFIAGCSTTHQARSVTTSGFLDNYAQLKEGEDGQAVLRYVRPGVNWASYNKIIIDPVMVYAGPKSDLASANQEQRQALASYFMATLKENLSQDFKLVNSPGPGVLRVRAAITDADSSMVMLNTVTTILPIGLAVSTLKRVVTGSDSFVGDAQAEMEILNSTDGVRLAAAVDKRIGTKAIRSKFGSWNDAKEAFDFWAERLRTRLAEARQGQK